MKRALEQLGVGRCYHMHELFSHPEHPESWESAAAGASVDWERLFEGRPTLVADSGAQEVLRMAQRLVLDRFCGGRFDDVDETFAAPFRARTTERRFVLVWCVWKVVESEREARPA